MAFLCCLGQVRLPTPTRKVVSTETAFPDSLLDFLRKGMDDQELEDKLGKMGNQYTPHTRLKYNRRNRQRRGTPLCWASTPEYVRESLKSRFYPLEAQYLALRALNPSSSPSSLMKA